MRSTLLILSAATFLVFALPQAASPCAYTIGVIFWRSHAPGPEMSEYLAGNLGILAPLRYGRTVGPVVEVVAYRYLRGLQVAGLDFPPRRPPDEARQAWESLRRAHGAPRSYSVNPYRTIRRETSYGSVYHQQLRNCFDDAFDTAVEALFDRREHYDREEFDAWLRGQDRVFAACRGEGLLPEPLDESWSPRLRADRSYQRGATHLYCGQYDEALALFREIAADEGSPWSSMSAYLVARTLFRRRGPDDPAEARRALEAVLAEPALAEVHDSAELLLGYYLLRQEPARRRRELAAELMAEKLVSPSRQKLIDYGRLLASADRENERRLDLTAWILAIRAGSKLPQLAVRRWEEDRSLHWLVAAAASVGGEDPSVAELLAAIEAVDTGSPAYLSLAYHRVRLLAATGELGEARRLGDGLLAGPELSISDRNRIRALLTRYAPELETFLRYAPMRAAHIGFDDGSAGMVPWNRPGDELERYLRQPLLFSDEVVFWLNEYFTPALLLEAAGSGSLPRPLRLQLGRVAWVRAFVAGDEPVAQAAASLLAGLEAEPQRTGLRVYLAARPGPDRRFAGTLHLLRNDGLSPVFHRLGKRNRLWCAGWPDYRHQFRRSGDAPEAPPFFDPALLAEAEALRRRLGEGESGQRTLGRIVLAWAREHPDDDRLPEALHRVVRSTRRGCAGERQGEISKAAFQLLHRRYPRSRWAEKTPHWFD